jgi:hypothetical protein
VVPHLIQFRGTLQNLSGEALTGPVDVTFSLYAEEAGGSALWFETQTVQADSLGNYTVLLGAMTPTGLPMELFTSGEAHWLGVQVTNLPEQSRVLPVSVPYAMRAGDAETLGGKPASEYLLSSQAGTVAAGAAATSLSGLITKGSTTTTTESPVTNTITASYIPVFTDGVGTTANSIMFQSGTKIGINTNTPGFNLDLNGNVFIVGTKTAVAGQGGTMRFREDTGTQRWLFGIPGSAGSQDFQMYNYANGHAPIFIQKGAASYSLYLNGNGNVGVGTTSPAAKLDVSGTARVSGLVTLTTGVTGNLKITGTGNALIFPDGTVLSTANASLGGGTITGVTAGTGLSGGGASGGVTLNIASNSCAAGLAMTGLPLTCSAFATLGANTFAGNQSVTGTSGVVAAGVGATAFSAQATDTSAQNYAVYGVANASDGVGVYGQANLGTTVVGVWGISSTGLAGLFSGDVSISGTLDAATKNFKIDDPLDPANKYLVHTSVESSDMKTIYDGTVTLDANGEATVQLPDWFEALNGNFRYQLTCVGGYAPVYIAQRIQNGTFRIAGGTEGLEADWQVTGIRYDPYAQAHPLNVVVDKNSRERGYYLRPELYG